MGCFVLLLEFLGFSKAEFWARFVVMVMIGLSMFVMIIVTAQVPSLLFYGIQARVPIGLVGILTCPWLHGNWEHFWSNFPFVVGFSVLILFKEPLVDFFVIWGSSQLVSGIGVWVLGPTTPAVINNQVVVIVTVGASGVVMGLFGALVVRLVFQR